MFAGKIGTVGGEVNAANLDKVQQTLTSMNQRGKGSESMAMVGSGGGSTSQPPSSSQSQKSQLDDQINSAHISIDVAAGSWQTTNGQNMDSTTVRDSAEFSTTSETEMMVEKDLTGQFRDVSRSFQSQGSNHSHRGVGHGGVGTGVNVLGEGEEKKDSQRFVGGDDKSDEDDIDDDGGLESLPGTYEEIYEISNRNRKRNKEKKRQRDGDDGDEAADVPQVAIAKGGVKPGKSGTAGSTNQSRTTVASSSSSSSSSSASMAACDPEFKRMGDRLFDESIYFAHASMQSGGDATGGGIITLPLPQLSLLHPLYTLSFHTIKYIINVTFSSRKINF